MLSLDDKRRLISTLAHGLADVLRGRGVSLATAESCTAGWISEAITEVPGSSAWFDRGFVVYSNQAKKDLLGVKASSLDRFGAVSEKVVCEMAKGALKHSRAGWSVAVSGIAGPDGGTADKPVGTVWIAWATRQGVESARWVFEGDRQHVRANAVIAALQGLVTRLRESGGTGIAIANVHDTPPTVVSSEGDKETAMEAGNISSAVA